MANTIYKKITIEKNNLVILGYVRVKECPQGLELTAEIRNWKKKLM